MNNLSDFSITSLESITFNSKNEILLKVVSCGEKFTVQLSGIVFFSLSNDDFDNEEHSSVIEVNHELRKISQLDNNNFSFRVDLTSDDNPKNFITVNGSSLVHVICNSVNVLEDKSAATLELLSIE